MSSFYLCSAQGCNKKYKTKEKLIDHLLVVHKQICEEDPESVEITKENKKTVSKEKDRSVEASNKEKLRQEVERKMQLELEIKKKEEEE